MEYAPIKRKTSGFAIASITLMIFVPPLAIIFGIMALRQINDGKNRLAGDDLAVAGIIVGCLFTFIVPVILFPMYSRAKEKAKETNCASNLKRIGMAILMYQQDYDGIYPTADIWTDVLFPYTNTYADKYDDIHNIYVCPAEENQQQQSYAYNILLSNINTKEINFPSRVVCIYDSVPGINQAGGQELLPNPGRHKFQGPDGKYYKDNLIGFADEHVLPVRIQGSITLIWDPKQPVRKP